MHVLKLDPTLKEKLWVHLLPPDDAREQAAFLFCRQSAEAGSIELDVVDSAFLDGADLTARYCDYLELSDATRIRLIKRAHLLNASLAELHSHPGPWPAAFSPADRRGLSETVPHMMWRLKGRPYLAIVVAQSGYDALLWRNGRKAPEPLAGIEVGGRLLKPTNSSLERWHDGS